MLRATIEIVPYGFEDEKRTLATLEIALQCVTKRDTVDGGLGHYVSTLTTDQRGPQPPKQTVALTHERWKGAAELVRRCLNAHLRKLPE